MSTPSRRVTPDNLASAVWEWHASAFPNGMTCPLCGGKSWDTPFATVTNAALPEDNALIALVQLRCSSCSFLAAFDARTALNLDLRRPEALADWES